MIIVRSLSRDTMPLLYLLVILIVTKTEVLAFKRIVPSFNSIHCRKQMSWNDPDWNWGYADGLAHDVAMKVRKNLRSEGQRESYIQELRRGDVDIESFKISFALRCQCAFREGCDGDGFGFFLMNKMAGCNYEQANGRLLLQRDLAELIISKFKMELAGDIELDTQENFNSIAAQTLLLMKFIENGL